MDMSDSVGLAIDVVGQCVRVVGEVDLQTAPLIDDAVSQLSDPVMLDLADVTFMDSTGLHVLIKLRRARPSMRVTAVSSHVERLLLLTDTRSLFEANVVPHASSPGPSATSPNA